MHNQKRVLHSTYTDILTQFFITSTWNLIRLNDTRIHEFFKEMLAVLEEDKSLEPDQITTPCSKPFQTTNDILKKIVISRNENICRNYLCDLWLRSILLSRLLRPPLQSISLGLSINSLDLLWMRSSSRSRSLMNCCWTEQSSILGWSCFCKGRSRDRLFRLLTTDVAPEAP